MKIVSTLLVIYFLFLVNTPAQAAFRWMDLSEFTKHAGRGVNDVTDNNGYWAGKIIAFGMEGTPENEDFTGKLKVQITWVTDRTDYQCHQVYIMQYGDLKDFTHRSLMLRKCR